MPGVKIFLLVAAVAAVASAYPPYGHVDGFGNGEFAPGYPGEFPAEFPGGYNIHGEGEYGNKGIGNGYEHGPGGNGFGNKFPGYENKYQGNNYNGKEQPSLVVGYGGSKGSGKKYINISGIGR